MISTRLLQVVDSLFIFQATATIDEDTMMEAKKVEKRMMFIPVAFILLRIWGTVRYFAYVSPLSVRTEVLTNIPLYALQVQCLEFDILQASSTSQRFIYTVSASFGSN